MFWKLPMPSASSPVEAVLDKEDFTLKELLDEEEIIQECKALNSRLINFLRDRAQVEQLLRYIIDDPPEDAENILAFKFPFIACEIFICEIDVILKTLVGEEETVLTVLCWLAISARTVPLMNYVQAHQEVFRKLVDLIGITSIMEVLVRLVGADDHVYHNFIDVVQWLADSNLLERAMEQALKEGIVGEAGALKRTNLPEKENPNDGLKEFNDANYWKVDREVAVLE